MCGRFALTADLDAVQLAFKLSTMPDSMKPRYNIAPSQPVAVITNDDPTALVFHRWGLIPSWSKDKSIGNKMINARSESAAEKPSFRAAFRRRRCLIPTDGYFEWDQEDKQKIPHYIHFEGKPVFAMAGLWEVWNSPTDGKVYTCSILTTDANEFMKPIHNRMPVILHPDDYALWLSSEEHPVEVLQALMKPYDKPEQMAAYQVSKLVNKPGNDTPECVQPLM